MSSATAFEIGATVDEPWMSTLPMTTGTSPPAGDSLGASLGASDGASLAPSVGASVAPSVGASVAASVGPADAVAAPDAVGAVVGAVVAPPPPHAATSSVMAIAATATVLLMLKCASPLWRPPFPVGGQAFLLLPTTVLARPVNVSLALG